MDHITGDKIQYVAIELVLKPERLTGDATTTRDLIQMGLFKGIRKTNAKVSDNEDFLLVKPPITPMTAVALNSDHAMNMFSMKCYNVMTFEVFDGNVRHIIFCKADDEDQKEVLKIIRSVMDKLKDAKRMTTDDGVIDISTYKNMPSEFTSPAKSVASSLNKVNHGAGTWNSQQNWNNRQNIAGGTAGTTTSWERKPFFYRRKSKVPHASKIKKLADLLDKVFLGDYIEPDWPEIPKEVEELSKGTAKTSATDNYDVNEIYNESGCPWVH
jgi:hypothetical protein